MATRLDHPRPGSRPCSGRCKAEDGQADRGDSPGAGWPFQEGGVSRVGLSVGQLLGVPCREERSVTRGCVEGAAGVGRPGRGGA